MKTKNKRKRVSDIDDYRIVRRTNMITYQKRLKAFRKQITPNVPDSSPQQRFKRRHRLPSPNAPNQNNLSSTPGNSPVTDKNPKKELNVIMNKLFGVRVSFFIK